MTITTTLRSLTFAICILTISAVQAQKFGHLNYGNLLLDLPQVVTANKQLEDFQKPLLSQVEAKYSAFQTNYQSAVQQIQSGELSPVQQKQLEEKLAKEQQAVQVFEQESQKKLMAKREELLRPILKTIEKAVTEVGQEGGYRGIFDTSNGQLLYATDSEDVMSLVKAKL